jgi:hypothetical protein
LKLPQSHRVTETLDADGLQSRPELGTTTRQMTDFLVAGLSVI